MSHPNTAAAKLFLLSSNRALDLFENHVTLRAIKGDVDPEHLTKVAHKLLSIAWEAQREGANNECSSAVQDVPCPTEVG